MFGFHSKGKKKWEKKINKWINCIDSFCQWNLQMMWKSEKARKKNKKIPNDIFHNGTITLDSISVKYIFLDIHPEQNENREMEYTSNGNEIQMRWNEKRINGWN